MSERYNIVVLGGGSGGLVVAAGAAILGAKVALVEKERIGGDCLWSGCVPSKAVLRSGKVAAMARKAADYGVEVGEVRVNFKAVMERMRGLRSQIEQEHDNAQRFREMGVEVFFGSPRFVSPTTVEVDGQRLESKTFCISTGSRPVAPPIDGLHEVGFLTNVSVFELEEMPRRLAVVGAGPIGLEMAQFFRRCGARVTVLEMARQILFRDDPDCAAILHKSLAKEGIDLRMGAKLQRVSKEPGGKQLSYEQEGQEKSLEVDEILVAAGRAPNVDGLNLEKAGVRYSRRGIEIDAKMRTSVPHIYACGDITGKFPFTHTAEASAKILLRNALFPGSAKMNWSVIPWTTFTDPEVAHLGALESELQSKQNPYRAHLHHLKEEDRFVVDGRTEGLVKILASPKGKILGAHICAPDAGELLQERTLAMTHGLKLSHVMSAIHIYPTKVRAIRRAADKSLAAKLTESRKKLLSRLFAWRR